MKKEVITFLLVGILLVSPSVLAQEQSQTYSGLNRFTDNVKMFFTSGDDKVGLALKIREEDFTDMRAWAKETCRMANSTNKKIKPT